MKKATVVFLLTSGIAYSLGAQTIFAQFTDSAAEAWYNKRIRNAKKGIREKVEMPIVVHSTGWGCTCPDYYIGTEPNYNSDGLWLSPLTSETFPVSDSVGHSLIVKGYFTGKTEDEEGDDTIVYHVPLFKIISWKVNKSGDSAYAPRVIK